MKMLRSLDEISTFSCDYALDLALLINFLPTRSEFFANQIRIMVVLDSKKVCYTV
jgi:hypothetical protein